MFRCIISKQLLLLGSFLFAGIMGVPRAMRADTLVTLNYTEYFDNQTNGYYPPFPAIPTSPSLNIPVGTSVTWTATIDVANPPLSPAPSPSWSISSSNLPADLTAVVAPWNIFLLPNVNTYVITGIVPRSFTWQGETYLGARTIQFPDCPVSSAVSSSCTATATGQYYFPGYWTYASTTFDTLSITSSASAPTPEPSTLLLLPAGLAALWVGARQRRPGRN